MFTKGNETGSNQLIKNRNFRLFFSARIISQLGDQIYVFAVMWYVLDITKSSLAMTVPLLLSTVITALVSIFGGTFADRVNRKRIMVLSDIVQGVILVVLTLLVIQNTLEIWMIYVLTAMLAFCGAVFSPAASAIVPDIVTKEQLSKATSANQLTISLCTMTGMLAGGVLYQLFGMLGILIFNASSNILSALIESAIHVPDKKEARANLSSSHPIKDLAEGYRYVKGNGFVFSFLTLNSIFVLFALPVGMVLIPYYFNVILHSTALQLAIPQACVWLGMILVSLIVPFSLRRHSIPTLIWRGLIFMSICTFCGVVLTLDVTLSALTSSQISLIWAAINLCCGISVNLFTIPLYTMFHQQTDDEYRGRFWGIENSVRTLALCCGYLLAGLLVQNVPLVYVIAAYGTVMLALSIIAKRIGRSHANIAVAETNQV